MSKLCVIKISWKERENRSDAIFKEMMVENSQNQRKTSSHRMHEALWTLDRINTKKTEFRHIIAKLLKTKDKERMLKTTRGKKYLIFKEYAIRLIADFYTETMEAGRQWNEWESQIAEGKSCQSRILYPLLLWPHLLLSPVLI